MVPLTVKIKPERIQYCRIGQCRLEQGYQVPQRNRSNIAKLFLIASAADDIIL
jgi:hypothetical protein